MTQIIREVTQAEQNKVFKTEKHESDSDDHEIDENKFTLMMYDESEFLIVNTTRLVKNGTMDDVYILEKVKRDEIESIMFIQSCVPKIKEFSYNLRFN
jgi:hypothetical protein